MWQWTVCDAPAAVAIYFTSILQVFILFSAHIQDALETDCEKCSEPQKKGSEKVIAFLYKNKPEQFKELQEKYDPDNKYYKRHEQRLKELTS